MRRTDRYRYPFMMTLLVLLQFTVRSHLGGDRVAPDFLLLALLIYTIRAEPGKSAAAGFMLGLLRDAQQAEHKSRRGAFPRLRSNRVDEQREKQEVGRDAVATQMAADRELQQHQQRHHERIA